MAATPEAHYRDNDEVLIIIPGSLMNLVREDARRRGLSRGKRVNQAPMVRVIIREYFDATELVEAGEVAG